MPNRLSVVAKQRPGRDNREMRLLGNVQAEKQRNSVARQRGRARDQKNLVEQAERTEKRSNRPPYFCPMPATCMVIGNPVSTAELFVYQFSSQSLSSAINGVRASVLARMLL